MQLYSVIVPVYNRPDEVDDLLASLTKQTYVHFEVLVIEDGSSVPCKTVVDKYSNVLDIYYYKIHNSGPGMARNYGAGKSRGNYLLILDSDCVLPSTWLEQIHDALKHHPVDAFGGPDRAHASFSPIQKAINYAMTSFFTTGGIRGGKRKIDRFYPRSFNMGVKREVYLALGGFSKMRYGEDIDFSLRIMKANYSTHLFPATWVYHKRRTSFMQFFRQVQHSGRARIELYRKYPDSLKLVHCLPTLFLVGVITLGVFSLFFPAMLLLLLLYCSILFIDACLRNRGSVNIAFLAVVASLTQLVGYGSGFIAGVGSASRDEIRKSTSRGR